MRANRNGLPYCYPREFPQGVQIFSAAKERKDHKEGVGKAQSLCSLFYYSRSCSETARKFHSVLLFGFRVRISDFRFCRPVSFVVSTAVFTLNG
jgi:hypothetical protein